MERKNVRETWLIALAGSLPLAGEELVGNTCTQNKEKTKRK